MKKQITNNKKTLSDPDPRMEQRTSRKKLYVINSRKIQTRTINYLKSKINSKNVSLKYPFRPPSAARYLRGQNKNYIYEEESKKKEEEIHTKNLPTHIDERKNLRSKWPLHKFTTDN